MSKTADLDKTIDSLNSWLETEKTTKGRLAVADRLIRALSLKYKFDTVGQGGKFNMAPESTVATNGASHDAN